MQCAMQCASAAVSVSQVPPCMCCPSPETNHHNDSDQQPASHLSRYEAARGSGALQQLKVSSGSYADLPDDDPKR